MHKPELLLLLLAAWRPSQGGVRLEFGANAAARNEIIERLTPVLD